MTTTPISTLSIPHILIFLLCLPIALAQFGGFFQQGFPFGGHHHQQQQQDQGGRAHKGWQEMDSGTSLIEFDDIWEKREGLTQQ